MTKCQKTFSKETFVLRDNGNDALYYWIVALVGISILIGYSIKWLLETFPIASGIAVLLLLFGWIPILYVVDIIKAKRKK